jgi:hypothetical protein
MPLERPGAQMMGRIIYCETVPFEVQPPDTTSAENRSSRCGRTLAVVCA